jgi:signal transduction histidine kinase/ligand-binding sensor domain-containing protein/DNA-binding response OmpR family regulator
MWFGTWNGLNRFDGYEFIVYKKEDSRNSLSNNFVYSISEDHQGDLWIGTKNGLNLYEFRHDRFIHFIHDSLNTNSPAGNWITSAYTDRQGTIWIGTNSSGLDMITRDEKNKRYIFTHFTNNVRPGSLSNNSIRSIYEDSKGRLWVATANGLNLFHRETKIFQRFLSVPGNPNSISFPEIRCVFEDRTGTIWVGTQFGLNRWIDETGNFVRYISNEDDPWSLSHFVVNDISEDPEGNLYFATLGGLDIYDRKNDRFEHLPVYTKTNFSLNNEFINTVFCDEYGLIWIGTEKGGINKFNIYQKQFHHLSAGPEDPVRLSHNTINSILDEQNHLWIGTAGGGLNILNKADNSIRHYRYDAHRATSIISDFITSICHDRNKNIWIGTWGGGFEKLESSAGKGSFRHHQHNPDDTTSLINNFVSTIIEDSRGNIWIGTEGGIDLYRPGENSFAHVFNNPASSMAITEVGCILEDRNNNLWVGTRNGLFRIPFSTLQQITGTGTGGKIYCYRNVSSNPASISENYVISLLEDSQGVIWVGTYGNGLNKLIWDPAKDSPEFTKYTRENELSNNIIYGILEDDEGYLWLSTDYGLSKFDSKTEKFRNYYMTEGLQSNQFYWSACDKGENGYLYFGGVRGLNYFHPDDIRDNTSPAIPVITDFKLFNNPVKVSGQTGEKSILNEVITIVREIKLSHRENTFSFEFSSLSYDLPQKNKYRYKLEGIDDDWITVNSDRRFANYTKLPGGDYIFKLQASNSDDVWNETPQELRVIITPPFWLTTWFRILLLMFIIISITAYLKLHTRSLQMQKRKLESQVMERTAQIEHQKEMLREQAEKLQLQNDQLGRRKEQIEGQKITLEQQNREILDQRDRLLALNKKVKAANQLKLKFFTNVSHEFRTPLTLILGPLEKLLKTWQTNDETRQLLDLINRNAGRLLHLINQLMDFRKIEKGKMELNIQQGDISAFIADIIQSFRDISQRQKINLMFEPPAITTEVWFDHVKLENIFYNLLSNAFKFTPENGAVSVSLKLKGANGNEISDTEAGGKFPEVDHFMLEVSDTGIGIAKEKLPYVFKRFYRAENEGETPAGSGIGLSLTRELVKIQHGKITVSSEPGNGTSFIVEIPCAREYFSGEEINRNATYASGLPGKLEQLRYSLENLNVSHHTKDLHLISHMNRPTILLVEDNFELQEFIAGKLNTNYNLLLAGNGKEALSLAKESNPDIIVSDIMMPVMDGLELCQNLKTGLDTSHIPIILLTAKSSDESQIEGYKTGADDYIPKPFNPELLEVRIASLIESRKKLRSLFSNGTHSEIDKITATHTDKVFLRKALELVENNIDNTEFDVTDFSAGMSVSRSLLHKKLTSLTDKSATDFINTVRLRRAQQLIKSGSLTISEVAYSVGYNDPKYFSRLFRKHFGIAPSDYTRENRRKVS